FTIEDTTGPILTTAASGQTVECDGAGNTSAFNAWLAGHGGGAANDACGGAVSWSDNSAAAQWVTDCGNARHIAIIFTAIDVCGNATPSTATFTIEDTSGPILTTAASGQTVECDGAGNTSALNAWLAGHRGAAANDACGGAVSWSDNSAAAQWVTDCGNARH